MASKTALNDARQRRGFTNRELARRAGIAEQKVSLMLRGYWGTPEDRARVRAVLGGELRELFPHVPSAELKRPAYLNPFTAELYGVTGPPVDEAPRMIRGSKASGGSTDQLAAGGVSNA
jgi:transcriptional regulator with XRE-family HTH domain